MANLHQIRAYLYDNALTENPNDLMARVHSERSLSIKDICTSAVTRGGSDISAASMEHAVNLWLKEMAYGLCDGFSVNTGWFNASASIKGVFDSVDEKFNPAKHTIQFEFHQGSQLRKELESVTIDIIGIANTSTSIVQVTDIKTGIVNEHLTPNRNLRINGHKLKIAGNNSANGVYFVNQTTHDRVKIEFSDIVNNKPSELMIIIPELPAGVYKLELTTQFSGSGGITLKEPRTAIFDRLLTVR